ncbi:hypothetical protein EP7_001639 [Isosphaeraceae bacterium EP7]
MRSSLRRSLPPVATALLVASLLSGCQGGSKGMFRRSAAKEPALVVPEGGVVVGETIPAKPAAFADRHPILSRPKEYYVESGGANGGMSKVVATGRAAFIGIPSGIGAEIKQMVTGVPAPSRGTSVTY